MAHNIGKITKLPPPKIMKDTCNTCRFFSEINPQIVGQPKQGLCYRFPPTPVVVPTSKGMQLQAVSIKMKATDWCGEWRTKISLN